MTLIPIVTILSSVCYTVATLGLALRLTCQLKLSKHYFLILGAIAVCLHAILLYHWIDQHGGHDLSAINLCSQMLWLVALLTLCTAIRCPIENLLLLVFPLALSSLIVAAKLSHGASHLISLSMRDMVHLLGSLLAVSALFAAILQALLLAIQQCLLKHKCAMSIMQVMPPLQTMETFLYQLIWVSMVLLTLVIVTSFLLFGHIFTPLVWAKSLIVILSWLVLVALLVGRYAYGWRGLTVVRMTVLCFFCLMIAYGVSYWLS